MSCSFVLALMGQVCLQLYAFGLQHRLLDVEIDVIPINFNILMVQGDCVFQCVLQRDGGGRRGIWGWREIKKIRVTRDTKHLRSVWIRVWRSRRRVRGGCRRLWIHRPELTRVHREPKIPDRLHCALTTHTKGLYRVKHNSSSGKGGCVGGDDGLRRRNIGGT